MDVSEIRTRIEKRRKKLAEIRKLKRQAEAEGVEIIAAMNQLGVNRVDLEGWVASVVEQHVASSFDAAMAERDYPIDRHPELYSVDYTKLKTYLAKGIRNPKERSKVMHKYLRTKKIMLRITRPRANQRRFTI